jgi:hypothetical protein
LKLKKAKDILMAGSIVVYLLFVLFHDFVLFPVGEASVMPVLVG